MFVDLVFEGIKNVRFGKDGSRARISVIGINELMNDLI